MKITEYNLTTAENEQENLIEQVNKALEQSVSSATKACVLISEYDNKGYDRQVLVSRTGLSQGTVSKMIKAGNAVKVFISLERSEQGFIEDLAYTPSYACYYALHKELVSGESYVYDLSYEDAVEAIKNARSKSKISDTEEAESEEAESDDIEYVEVEEIVEDNTVTIKLDRDIYQYMLDALSVYQVGFELDKADIDTLKYIANTLRKEVL